MNSQNQRGLDCSQFEALLAEALDRDRQETPAGADETWQAFDRHRDSCAVCGPLYDEARQGMLALQSLGELEPPKSLVHNILAATSRAEQTSPATAQAGVKESWFRRGQAALRPSFAGLMRSRFATSFAMAFFSLSLTLTLAGVRISDVAKIDWRPNAVRRSVVLQYSQMEASVMRYYDNMKIVYTVRNTVRELRNASTSPDQNKPSKPEQKQRKPAPDTSGQPDRHENYSVQRDGSLMANNTTKNQGAQL